MKDSTGARLERIGKAAHAMRKAEEELTAAVLAARTPVEPDRYWHPEVPTWSEIAEAIGVTRQAVSKRWGGIVPAYRASRW